MQKEKRKNDPAILIQNMMESQLIQWRWTNVNHTYYTFAHRAKKILEENIFTSIFEIECSKENYKKFHNFSSQQFHDTETRILNIPKVWH